MTLLFKFRTATERSSSPGGGDDEGGVPIAVGIFEEIAPPVRDPRSRAYEDLMRRKVRMSARVSSTGSVR